VLVIRDGMKMITESAATTPLMKLNYALNDKARAVIERYTDLA